MKNILFLLMLLGLMAGAAGSTQAQVSFGTPTTIGVGTNPLSVVVADVHWDGRPDLLTANFGSNNVSVRFGLATGRAM